MPTAVTSRTPPRLVICTRESRNGLGPVVVGGGTEASGRNIRKRCDLRGWLVQSGRGCHHIFKRRRGCTRTKKQRL